MASESRRSANSLRERLEAEIRRFELLQAARVLRKLAPEREPVGRDAEPDREAVRFRSDVSTAFPTSDLVAIDPPEEPGGPPRLTVAFLGVATPASFGSLPAAYGQAIREQGRDKSTVLRDFLDCFNHRLVSLYVRAFEKYRFGMAWEGGDTDFFERALRGVLGLGTPALAERLSFPDSSLFSRGGLLAMAAVSAPVLESLIASHFALPARVEQFLAAWYELDPEDRTRLGAANATLGVDVAVGSRVRLAQFRFRIRVGPLRFAQYQELLPGGSAFEAIFDLVRLAAGTEQTFEVRLVLQAEEVPPFRLGEGSPCRLGWSTWLHHPDRWRDADDAAFPSELSVLRRARPAARRAGRPLRESGLEDAA